MSFPSSAQLLAALVPWFETHRRSLPWRAEDLNILHPDPYAVLVSELMLQQTQVTTVIPYFTRWMERFPDAQSLARAGADEIHRYWQGLGYYRRAGHLQAAAARIASAGWPADLTALKALPGLGEYTAAALSAIAFQRPDPALDGNAFRVIARLLGVRKDPRGEAAELREWLRPALEAHGPSRMTQALMELGALVCLPTPKCETCPLRGGCQAEHLGLAQEIPARATRAPAKEVELWLVALEAEGAFLLVPPARKGLLSGLWRWPSVETLPQAMAAESPMSYTTLEGSTWPGWVQVYTHRKECVTPVHIQLPERVAAPADAQWVGKSELARLPMGKRDQRLRGLLEEPSTACADLPVNPLTRGILGGVTPCSVHGVTIPRLR